MIKKFLIALVAAAALAGCASKETKEQPPAAVEDRQPGATETKPPVKVEPSVQPLKEKPLSGQALGAAALKDPNNILSKRSVYYDYDSSIVKDEYKPLITAHARYLMQNRSARLTIQGNTDERGSREYNIALGQRRAESVKQMMVLLGANEQQIETVSFGEEKPRAEGHDEAAWAQNRRSDIVYAGE